MDKRRAKLDQPLVEITIRTTTPRQPVGFENFMRLEKTSRVETREKGAITRRPGRARIITLYRRGGLLQHTPRNRASPVSQAAVW